MFVFVFFVLCLSQVACHEICVEESGLIFKSIEGKGSPWNNTEDASCSVGGSSYCDMIAYDKTQMLYATNFTILQSITQHYDNFSLLNISLSWEGSISYIPPYGCFERNISMTKNNSLIDLTVGNSHYWNTTTMIHKIHLNVTDIHSLLSDPSFGFGFSLENGAVDITSFVNCMSVVVCLDYDYYINVTEDNTTVLPINDEFYIVTSDVFIVGLIVVPCLLLASLIISIGSLFMIRKKRKFKKNGISNDNDSVLDILQNDNVWKTGVKIEGVIGNGDQGKIYLGKWKGKEISCKSIRMNDDLVLSEEITHMVELHNVNVMVFYGLCRESTHSDIYYMLTEHSAIGDLKSFLVLEKKASISTLCNLAMDICRGMNYIGERCIIHRNLSTKSVFLFESRLALKSTGKKSIYAKVGNFEKCKLSGSEDEIQTDFTDKVSPRCNSPEGCLQQTFTKKNDVWSFGLLLYEIFNEGESIFDISMSDQDITDLYASKKDLAVNRYKNKVPEPIKSIIPLCFNYEQSARPTFAELLRSIDSFLHSASSTVQIDIGGFDEISIDKN